MAVRSEGAGVVSDVPTRRRDNRTSTCLRFPPELHEQLRQAADDRDLSINYLVVKAVEDFLPRLLPPDQIRFTRRDASS